MTTRWPEVLSHPEAFTLAGLHLDGLVAISQGFMLTCMIWAAMSTLLIERQFLSATVWAVIGALLAFFGFTHAGEMTPAGRYPTHHSQPVANPMS
ncbi:MAG: hypothetical protein GY856_06600 [bacterium]|nr:hypothetical protein [bacterium]